MEQEQEKQQIAKKSNKKNSSESDLKFKRDQSGLVCGINYQFNDNGTINWRSMIQKEHLVPNRDLFKNQDTKEIDVSTLPDNQLLILLAGIKDLAQIRGYESVKYKVIQAGPQYVAVKCTIKWLPNYETSMQPVSFSSLADAHLDNTKSFAKDFLMAIAENRAFVRAVRNFLRINIVGSDEMGDSTKSTPPVESNDAPPISATHPSNVLSDLMKKANISFDKIKETMNKEGIQESETWNSINDIPNKIIFSLIQRLKKKINTN
jgi:hypothetical protein